MKTSRFFIFMFLLYSSGALSDCLPADMSITGVSPGVIDFRQTNQVNVTYQIFHAGFTGAQDCYFFNDFDYGTSASFVSRNLVNVSSVSSTIPFNVYSSSLIDPNNIVRLAEDASIDNHVIFSLPPFTPSPTPQSQTRNFIAELGSVPVNSPPGLYTESLVFRLRARLTSPPASDYSSFPITATRAIQFIYEIPRTLNISLVSSGGSFDPTATGRLMSFDILTAGEASVASLFVETNVGYRLFASSQNNGLLSHTTASSTVPYEFRVNGGAVSLLGSSTLPVLISSDAASSPAGGFQVPLEIVIGTMTGAELGGTYRDAISLNIEAF